MKEQRIVQMLYLFVFFFILLTLTGLISSLKLNRHQFFFCLVFFFLAKDKKEEAVEQQEQELVKNKTKLIKEQRKATSDEFCS